MSNYTLYPPQGVTYALTPLRYRYRGHVIEQTSDGMKWAVNDGAELIICGDSVDDCTAAIDEVCDET